MRKIVFLTLVLSCSSALAADWNGRYQLVSQDGANVGFHCDPQITAATDMSDGIREVRVSGTTSRINVRFRDQVQYRMADSEKDWSVGFIRQGGTVWKRRASKTFISAALGFGFIPALLDVGEQVKLNSDASHLIYRKFHLYFGFGTRTKCEYVRIP